MADRFGTVWRRNRRDRLMNLRGELLAIASDFEQMGYRTEWVTLFRDWVKQLAEVVRQMGVAEAGPVDRDPKF